MRVLEQDRLTGQVSVSVVIVLALVYVECAWLVARSGGINRCAWVAQVPRAGAAVCVRPAQPFVGVNPVTHCLCVHS